MARRIPLKTVELAIDGVGVRPFSYGETIRSILKLPAPGRGLTLDEVIAAMASLAPVEAALAAGGDSVTLSEEQWQTLLAKLNQFGFALADQAIVEFGLAIRNAPELT